MLVNLLERNRTGDWDFLVDEGLSEAITSAWQLPEPAAVLRVTMADGAVVYVRRHGNPAGPRILLSHGCGMATDAYLPFWSSLCARFDLFLYDLRSHGWNPPGELKRQNIPTFVQDCEVVLRAIGESYGEKPVIGVFHSLSGLVALLHEEKWKGFAALVLFDVPVQPPGEKPEDLVQMGETMSAYARRRRDWFKTREEFAERLSNVVAFKRLVAGTTGLLAQTTLRPAAGGVGFELRCPREHEAQVYEYLFGWAMRVDLQKVSCPVKIVGADQTEPYSFVPAMDLREQMEANYDFISGTTHFLQLEQPGKCLDITLDFLKSQSLI